VIDLLQALTPLLCYRSRMHYTQADLKAALEQIIHAEDRIQEQKVQVACLQRHGHSTELAEDLLRVLIQSRQLLQKHLARVTNPAEASNLCDSSGQLHLSSPE
jgi:hypothetical protein